MKYLQGFLWILITFFQIYGQSKFNGGAYDGSSSIKIVCVPFSITSNKYNGGSYDGSDMEKVACPPIVIVSNKYNGGSYDGSDMEKVACPTIMITSNKYNGGSYDGSDMEKVACPVIIVSNKYNGGSYDGSDMEKVVCSPVVIVSNKFNGSSYDGSDMEKVSCPPIVIVSNKYNGSAYDGSDMEKVSCPPIVIVSNKYNGGIQDGHDMERQFICNPLPISPLTLQASWYDEGKALLKWNHREEYNVDYYEIYRSKDREYASVAHVIPAAYNDQLTHDYELIDKNLSTGNYTYWVQSVDYNGKSVQSNVVYLWLEEQTIVMAYPNPFRSQVELLVQMQENTFAELKILDNQAKQVYQNVLSLPKGNSHHTLELENLSTGMYILKLETTSGKNWSFKLLKVE